MGWGKLDDRRHTNAKMNALCSIHPLKGLAANGLDANGITYCSASESDGFVADAVLIQLAPGLSRQLRDELAGMLMTVGRWTRDTDNGGWWIHNFLDYNPEHADLEKKREADRERKAGQKRGSGGQFQAESDWNPSGIRESSERSRTVPSRPDPSRPDPLVVTTPNNCNPYVPPDGEAGADASHQGEASQIREVVDRLRQVCTASSRKAIDRESTLVVAECLRHCGSDIDLLVGAMDELERWKDPPPSLPRLLFKAFAIECRRRGRPAPLLVMPAARRAS